MILHLALQAMVMVPAGTFTMGSSPDQQAWAVHHGATASSVADEGPQHSVTLPAFALGQYDVTRDEYATFVHETHRVTPPGCGRDSYKWDLDSALSWEHPGFRQTGHDPVVCVSWNDAQAYVAWLNTKAGGTSYPSWMWRAATRERNPADFRDRVMGFRIAKTL